MEGFTNAFAIVCGQRAKDRGQAVTEDQGLGAGWVEGHGRLVLTGVVNAR
jgi:hypothetical protein